MAAPPATWPRCWPTCWAPGSAWSRATTAPGGSPSPWNKARCTGLCGYGWSALQAAKPGWVDGGKINILVQLALNGDAALIRRGVPMIWDYVKKPEDRKVLELILSQTVFARPYVMPPETPRERVRSMRRAFGRTLQDPEFLGDARKSKLAIARVSGSEVEAVIDRIFSAPPEVIARAKVALASK